MSAQRCRISAVIFWIPTERSLPIVKRSTISLSIQALSTAWMDLWSRHWKLWMPALILISMSFVSTLWHTRTTDIMSCLKSWNMKRSKILWLCRQIRLLIPISKVSGLKVNIKESTPMVVLRAIQSDLPSEKISEVLDWKSITTVC